MPATQPDQKLRFEPRWPVGFAIAAVLGLLAALPGRIRLFPGWIPYVLAIIVLTPIVGTALAARKERWLHAERMITLLFCSVTLAGTFANIANLIGLMLNRPGEVSGLQLLASSIAVWISNVLLFSLVYWQMDRGGPGPRDADEGRRPDWQFPQTGAPEDAPLDWRPSFVDYLFLGFSTATAFSPTDALPLTSRAKLLMMLESSLSLATIVIVASRAINILGS